MRGLYQRCPTCGNNQGGHDIYICDKCHHMFCRKCRNVHCFGPLWLFEDPKCPVCGETDKVRIVGSIER